ncbi:MAG: hypothetical protein AAF570_28260, partial [Bacteroidota bacterium]
MKNATQTPNHSPFLQRTINGSDIAIPEPCSVPWDAMEALPDGNRFCQQCQKTVFDLGDKSKAELQAIFDTHGKEICGNLFADQLVERDPEPHKRPQANIFKTIAAAAATLALLHTPNTSSANGPEKPRTELTIGPNHPNPSDNTLLTGVLLNSRRQAAIHDLTIKIRKNGKTGRQSAWSVVFAS